MSHLQSQEKVTVTRSLTGGRSTRTKENPMLHLRHAYFSLLSEEGFQLGVFLSGGRLNTFLDSGHLMSHLFHFIKRCRKFCLSYVFYVGPLLAGPAEKLPPEFEKIMQDSGDNGVLLVSFGTEIGMLNDNINSAIAEAVSKLNQTVIWKIKLPTHIKVSSNVKTFDWIPQNDLLGHEKLKAFVSHMGNNGAYEAAYHGVPLIAAPVWMDNLSNTKRFEHKAKMAKFIDVFKADSSEWQNTIKEVLFNPSYKTNALRVSKLIRSHPRTAVQRAGDLIEYTLVNGGRLPHLKAHAFNLTWYQYYSIDVVAFLAAVVIFGTFITVKFVMLVFRCAKGVFAKDKLKKT